MNTTIGSCAPHAPAIATLPPETQQWLYDCHAELKRLQAQEAALYARQCDQANHAGHVWSHGKRRLVLMYMASHLTALLSKGRQDRCQFLRKRMEEAQDRIRKRMEEAQKHGEPITDKLFDIPDDRLLRKCLKKIYILARSVETAEAKRTSVKA